MAVILELNQSDEESKRIKGLAWEDVNKVGIVNTMNTSKGPTVWEGVHIDGLMVL